jgi:hypothetical protein
MRTVEFDIGGVAYRADQLDAFKQLHVSRKIAPVVPKLIPVFVLLQKVRTPTTWPRWGTAAGPFAEALAALPEADVDYVVKTCLASVKREQGGAWAPLMAGGALMFADLDLGQMLPIVVRVLRENLGNFIQGLLANVPATPAPLPAQAG